MNNVLRSPYDHDRPRSGPESSGLSFVYRHGAIYGPAAVLLTLAVLSAFKRPLWRDEVATRLFSGLSAGELATATDHVDSVFAPYYFLVHVITAAGSQPIALRALSIFAGTVAIIVVGHLARRWWSPSAALIAGMFLALNPLFIEVSATARPYALATMLVACAFYFVDRASQRGRQALSWIGFCICVYFVGLTHLLALLAIGATGVLFIGKAKGKILAWAAACGVVAFALLPFALHAFSQHGQVSWIPQPTLRSAVGSLASLLVYERDGHLGVAQAISVLLVSVVCLATLNMQLNLPDSSKFKSLPARLRLVFSGTAFVLPWLLLLVESMISTPYLRTMYLTPSLIGISLLLGGAFSLFFVGHPKNGERTTRRRPRRLGQRLVVILVGVSAILASLAVPLPTTQKAMTADWWKDDFSGLATSIADSTVSGDVIAFLQSPSETGVKAGIAHVLDDVEFASSTREQVISGQQSSVELRRVVSAHPFRTKRVHKVDENDSVAIVYTRGGLTGAVLGDLKGFGINCVAGDSKAARAFGLLRYDRAACYTGGS